MTNIHLPKRVNFNIARLTLGLQELQLKDAIEVMLAYIDELDLKIYFDTDIYGQKKSDPIDPIFDEQGDVTKVMSGGATHHFNGSSKMINIATASCNDTTISISSFIIAGERYYSLDETELWLESASLPLIDCYMEPNNLNAVKAKVNISKNKNIPALRTKNTKPVQQVREEQFITWLCSTVKKTRTTDATTLQKYYEDIGSPTQQIIWKKLVMFDPVLFSKGRSDFFKFQKVIKLAQGTGKGR